MISCLPALAGLRVKISEQGALLRGRSAKLNAFVAN
jgi:hypothetical protein